MDNSKKDRKLFYDQLYKAIDEKKKQPREKTKEQKFETVVKIFANENYYTPQLEEFNTLFEFEVHSTKDKFFWGEFEGWVKAQMDFGILGTLANVQNLILDKQIRVKILCHEDIEDCGWDGGMKIAGRISYHNRERLLFHYPENNRVCITQTVGGLKNVGDEAPLYNIFDGYVRNKSELKSVMKQLNIILK